MEVPSLLLSMENLLFRAGKVRGLREIHPMDETQGKEGV